MSTLKRLSQVLASSPRIPINNYSRIIIMSDCHRGVGGWSDNFLDNQNLFLAALTYYYDRGYTYIELGDGDELWENRSLKNIIQTHSDPYWLMSQYYREGRLHMIYGNHDIVKRNPQYYGTKCKTFYCDTYQDEIELFPGIQIHEGLFLSYANTNYGIFLTHGHQADVLNDTLWRLSRFLVRYLWRPLELIGIRDPTSAAKNNDKKNTVEKKLMDWSDSQNQMLICGHTHRPVFPNKGETLYFNDGSCIHPRSITGIEITNGTIALIKWSIKIKPDLTLFVGREVMEGPVHLMDFFFPKLD